MLHYRSNSAIKTACLYYFSVLVHSVISSKWPDLLQHIFPFTYSLVNTALFSAKFGKMHQTFLSVFSYLGWQDGEREMMGWERERERELLICASPQRSKSLEVSGTDRKRVTEPPIHLVTIQEHPGPSALSHNTLSALIILIIHCTKRENSLCHCNCHTILQPWSKAKDSLVLYIN